MHWESVDRPIEQFSKLDLGFKTGVITITGGLVTMVKLPGQFIDCCVPVLHTLLENLNIVSEAKYKNIYISHVTSCQDSSCLHFWSEPLININEQDCSVNMLTLRCHDHNCPVCPLTLPPSHSLNPFQLISRHLGLKTPLKQACTGSKGQNC